jgi:hypothetical protein
LLPQSIDLALPFGDGVVFLGRAGDCLGRVCAIGVLDQDSRGDQGFHGVVGPETIDSLFELPDDGGSAVELVLGEDSAILLQGGGDHCCDRGVV